MKIECSLPLCVFPEGFEMIINGDLYTVDYAKVVDEDTWRIEGYLKKYQEAPQ